MDFSIEIELSELHKRILELESKVAFLEKYNRILIDSLDEWKMKYFRAQETINDLEEKNNAYYKKYQKYLQKYKDAMNNARE